MKNVDIAFIGGGNMARSLIGGLIADGVEPARIWVADPDPASLRDHQNHFGVHTTADNAEAVRQAQVIVLAVKPQVVNTAARGLIDALRKRPALVISVAAGIREPHLRTWLGQETAIVRCMPNTPALVGSGATALFANLNVTTEQKDLAESILRAVGMTLWVDDEDLLDAVTALSGSGPAYFFLVMEAMEQAGVALGLPRRTARLLTLQTAFGAAKMALESTEEVAALRRRVTSPGGTTEQAIKVLEEHGLAASFEQALRAARQRSIELASLFGGEK
ncbi:MAG: pyrroline-5-carboxylate reductase [Pseudomonadota bacterium]